MPRAVPDEQITRIGEVDKGDIEFFKVAVMLLPRQRKAFRTDKSKYLWKLFERHSYVVNNFYVSTVFVEKVDKLLDKAPPNENIPLSFVVFHFGRGSIYRRSTYI